MSDFKITTNTIVQELHTCNKCGFIVNVTEATPKELVDKYINKHLKTCLCDHDFTEYSTVNLGTWPDNEMYTSRRCKKCNIKEVL